MRSPKGRTALLDAIYLGMNRMRKAHYEKKALLIISDGGDNHSRYTEGEIKSMVREADVQIYGIGLFDRDFKTPEEREGPALLSEVTEVTGGRTFTIDNPERTGRRRHEDWNRAAQPICARIPSNQSSTRWQVAEDQGEAESAEGPAAAARVRQNGILCTYGIDRYFLLTHHFSAAGKLADRAEFDAAPQPAPAVASHSAPGADPAAAADAARNRQRQPRLRLRSSRQQDQQPLPPAPESAGRHRAGSAAGTSARARRAAMFSSSRRKSTKSPCMPRWWTITIAWSPTWTKTDFSVFEDGKPQKITSFRSEDIPVAMGIVIDNSGSMRDKRPAVNAAAINLVKSSNPQDKVFIVNFNEEYFLDQDYTAQRSQAEGCAGAN